MTIEVLSIGLLVIVVMVLEASGAHNIILARGRPVNVKHDARCVMGKVGEAGRQKTPKGGKF